MTLSKKDQMAEFGFKKAVRTSQGLRDVLFNEIDALGQGKSNPQKAQAVANLAKQIISTVRAEIDFHSHVASAPAGTAVAMGTPLQLGSRD